MTKGLCAALALFLAGPVMPVRAETPSIKLTAPARMPTNGG